MSMLLWLLIAAVLLLAYGNGANDNFKGVATLYGSGTTSYRRALAWATAATLVGSMLALLLASGLVDAFKGKGLVPDVVTLDPVFLLAVSLGAASTVLLATLIGLPVSTTHALIGGLAGAGLVATVGQIAWPALLKAFLLPVLVSPLLSVLLTLGLYPLLHRLRRRLGVERNSCLCVGGRDEPVRIAADGTMAFARTGMAIEAGRAPECVQRYQGRVLGWEAGRMLDGLHFLSGGAVCLARELNDTPKIVALLPGCAGRGAALRLGAGGRGDGRWWPAQCAQGDRHHQPPHHHDDPRSGTGRQPGHRRAGHRGQPHRAASLDHARLGRRAVRHRPEQRQRALEGGAHHPAGLGHHAAAGRCWRRWPIGCCAAWPDRWRNTMMPQPSRFSG